MTPDIHIPDRIYTYFGGGDDAATADFEDALSDGATAAECWNRHQLVEPASFFVESDGPDNNTASPLYGSTPGIIWDASTVIRVGDEFCEVVDLGGDEWVIEFTVPGTYVFSGEIGCFLVTNDMDASLFKAYLYWYDGGHPENNDYDIAFKRQTPTATYSSSTFYAFTSPPIRVAAGEQAYAAAGFTSVTDFSIGAGSFLYIVKVA